VLSLPSVPIPLAWLVAFAFGAAFAKVAQAEIARAEGPLVASRPMAVVLGFAGLVFFPVVAYFAAFHGDWAYLYLVSWQNVPSAVDLALVLATTSMLPAGFITAVGLIRTRRSRAARGLAILIGLPLAFAATLALVLAHRLGVSASAAQYAGGFGVEPIAQSVLGKGLLWGLLALGSGAAWAIRALRTSP
jgi:hypothetical protein